VSMAPRNEQQPRRTSSVYSARSARQAHSTRDPVHSVVQQALLQLSQLISLDFYSYFCHVPPKVNFDHTKVSFAFSVSSAVSTFAKTRSSINMLYAALADSRDLNTAAITIQRCGLILCFLVQTWICLCLVLLLLLTILQVLDWSTQSSPEA
jgi:hypothetical protein